jgi:hypothetical protein
MAAARDRLVERFLRKSGEPPDFLEEDAIINDLASYMGYLFQLGYRDFESNLRKLTWDLAAAVSLRVERAQLEHLKQREHKIAAMMQTSSRGPVRLN